MAKNGELFKDGSVLAKLRSKSKKDQKGFQPQRLLNKSQSDDTQLISYNCFFIAFLLHYYCNPIF